MAAVHAIRSPVDSCQEHRRISPTAPAQPLSAPSRTGSQRGTIPRSSTRLRPIIPFARRPSTLRRRAWLCACYLDRQIISSAWDIGVSALPGMSGVRGRAGDSSRPDRWAAARSRQNCRHPGGPLRQERWKRPRMSEIPREVPSAQRLQRRVAVLVAVFVAMTAQKHYYTVQTSTACQLSRQRVWIRGGMPSTVT